VTWLFRQIKKFGLFEKEDKKVDPPKSNAEMIQLFKLYSTRLNDNLSKAN
jgi:hypothetical protein